MRLLIAPDSFKESLTAVEAAGAIARGVGAAAPGVEVVCVPMADGGEGTVEAMVSATGGAFHTRVVTGPLGEPVEARWGMMGGAAPAAVIEMSAASGLALVPSARRNPTLTTTYGTGELIRAALDAGAERILLGIGGSATTDGGAAVAQALGAQFFDAGGQTILGHLSGGRLAEIARIDLTGLDARLAHVAIDVACDVTNPLCGPNGSAAVFGPQKGATPEQVRLLDGGLAHLARVIERDLGVDVLEVPGAGAAGGLGAGMLAFFNARLRRGIELVIEATRLREQLKGVDLVITGEGRLDGQSMMGKVIAGVAGAAREAGVPVIALVGCVGPGAEASLSLLESYHAITPAGMPLTNALAQASSLLEKTAADVIRKRLSR